AGSRPGAHSAARPRCSTSVRVSRRLTRAVNAVLLEQRTYIRPPATKLDESLERIAAAATAQDGVEETLRGRPIEHAVLLEGRERIRRQDFRPLVAVVAGGIAAREDVSEAVWKAVPFRHRHHRHLCPYLAQGVENAAAALGGVLGVNAE